MAIYHLSAQVIKRSEGRSSVAASAYRSASKIVDERTGIVHDFTQKKCNYSNILSPDFAPSWVQNRGELWNKVEQSEKRKDAQLAREFNIALPSELTNNLKIELIELWCKKQVERGMIADLCIHHIDESNPHAHVMLTMRDITPTGFGKKNRDWNDKELIESQRLEWEVLCNEALESAHINSRIDRRTLAAQGIDRSAQIHTGNNPARIAKNEEIKKQNKLLEILERAKSEVRKAIDFMQSVLPGRTAPGPVQSNQVSGTSTAAMSRFAEKQRAKDSDHTP